jgi:hypothetical protein
MIRRSGTRCRRLGAFGPGGHITTDQRSNSAVCSEEDIGLANRFASDAADCFVTKALEQPGASGSSIDVVVINRDRRLKRYEERANGSTTMRYSGDDRIEACELLQLLWSDPARVVGVKQPRDIIEADHADLSQARAKVRIGFVAILHLEHSDIHPAEPHFGPLHAGFEQHEPLIDRVETFTVLLNERLKGGEPSGVLLDEVFDCSEASGVLLE